MNVPELPRSVNLLRIESKSFYITAASWENSYGGTQYEIGIRNKEDNGFKLIQSDWGPNSCIRAAEAIKILLDNGFTPDEMNVIFK